MDFVVQFYWPETETTEKANLRWEVSGESFVGDISTRRKWGKIVEETSTEQRDLEPRIQHWPSAVDTYFVAGLGGRGDWRLNVYNNDTGVLLGYQKFKTGGQLRSGNTGDFCHPYDLDQQ